jgi:peptidoglycan/xylan/chitin deacetylase (PgdA/CDA1 family)
MEIGSHSTTHPDFRTLDDAAARDEFTRSKAVIEAEIDAEITSFAFPFGFAPPHHYQLARAAGYQYVMGSHHGRIDGHRDRILPRNSIHGGMDQAQIARTMQPDAELLVRWWLEDRVKATLKTLLPEQVYHRIRGAIARTGPQQ